MLVVLLVFIFLIIALFDAPGLVRKKYWRELAVYSGLMLSALFLSILVVIGAPLPAVTTEITNLVKAVFHLTGLK